MQNKSVFIVAAKRTAFGDFGGSLKHLSATELGAISSKAALDQLPKGTPIDSIIFGNVLQTSADAPYLSRHVGLRIGLPETVPAVTINRLCGSGFESIIQGAREILCGDAEIVLTGGSESMSQAPYVLRQGRWGIKYGTTPKMDDSLAVTLVDQYPKPTPMGITAENLAAMYNISRTECDQFAVSSQSRWAKANVDGEFIEEITGIEIKGKKETIKFETDEGPREGTTVQSISKLKPVFKENGVTTAANASGITDGSATVIIASEKAVEKYNLEPLARIVSYQASGVKPEIMGIGPVPAIKSALQKAKLQLKDMGLVEVNEAFAAQCLSVIRELGLNPEITNIHGGAISLGHPLAASGARIITHLSYQLRKSNIKYAVGSACIGGGQGIAIILEKV